MPLNQVIGPISSSILISIIIKCIIESIACLCIIIINGLLIASLLYIKRLRTTQNLLLINVSFACIFFSLSCILSISLTIYTIYSKSVNSYICQLIGFTVILSCHSLMFSYTLVAFVRFLTIICPFNKKFTTLKSIQIFLILKWMLAFIVSSIILILPNKQITFQSKAKMCIINQQSPVLFSYFCTGYIIPFMLISLMNLITFVNVIHSRQISYLSRTRLSHLNKRKRRNLCLLRQFSFFTIFFVFGWTPFIIIEIFDKQEKLSDIFYLFTLVLPSICVLIDSSAILKWNKTVHHQVQLWWRLLIKKTQINKKERNDYTIDQDSAFMGTIGDIGNLSI